MTLTDPNQVFKVTAFLSQISQKRHKVTIEH